MPLHVEGHHVATLRAAGHAAERSDFYVNSQAWLQVITKWTTG
jgi:hypothetical protein